MKKQKNNTQKHKNKERKKIKRKLIVKQKSQLQPKKKLSFSALKKSIIQIPALIFEPEIEAIAFDLQRIKENQAKNPLILDEYKAYFEADTIILDQANAALNAMEARLQGSKEKTKLLNVQTLLRIMATEENRIINQLLIAKYLKHRYEILQIGEEVTINNVIDITESFADQFITDDSPAETDALSDDQFDDQPEIELSQFDRLTEELISDIKENKPDSDFILSVEADSEAFFNDFLADEKAVESLEKIELGLIKEFLREWYIQNLKPSSDDMRLMLTFLQCLFQFILDKEKAPELDSQSILEHLKKRDEFYISLVA